MDNKGRYVRPMPATSLSVFPPSTSGTARFFAIALGLLGAGGCMPLAIAKPAASAPAGPAAPASSEGLAVQAKPVGAFVRQPPSPTNEVRATWVTTTANSAIASAADTAVTMRRLREIGLNTVYVETWKNGYTQYPSEVLKRVIGVDRRPNLQPQDPSDTPDQLKKPARDLLEETLIESHRNGLIYNAWFEYGFMAAHKSTDNHLRRMKQDWLSRDKTGNEVATNGFVWMNPLHPEPRQFLLDLVIEAVDRYDLDGVQLDDRIVWPYINMGYDDYTKSVYAKEHGGKLPPDNERDPAWMRWRADKVNEYAKRFVTEVRAKRPGLIISLSPAVYPWCYEYYLLEWPKWAAWQSPVLGTTGRGPVNATMWDEFIPQNYRFSYKAFETTWLDQIKHVNEMGNRRQADLLAGIRVVGDGPDSTWEDLKSSMDLMRKHGNGGSVHWFSRGVLDVYPKQLTEYYTASGKANNPLLPANWRPGSIVLVQSKTEVAQGAVSVTGGPVQSVWTGSAQATKPYQVIVRRTASSPWAYVRDGAGKSVTVMSDAAGAVKVALADAAVEVEVLIDRRPELQLQATGK